MIIVWLKELKCNIRYHMCTLKMVWLSLLLRELNWLQDHYCITVIYLLPVGDMHSYMLLISFNCDQLHTIVVPRYVLYVVMLQAFPICGNLVALYMHQFFWTKTGGEFPYCTFINKRKEKKGLYTIFTRKTAMKSCPPQD
jgi:hypothetical protein